MWRLQRILLIKAGSVEEVRMYFCESCKVRIRTNNDRCPLCQGRLSGSENEVTEPFPTVEKVKHEINPLILKIFTFAIIVAIVVSNIINYLVSPHLWWGGYVLAGGGVVWIVVIVALIKRRNVFKNLLWQFIIVNSALIIYDVSHKFNGWSLDFSVPISLMAVLAGMILTIFLQKLDSPDYMIYLLLTGIIGLVPGIFLFTGIVGIKLPSAICGMVSLILIAALIIFQFKAVKIEINKKFHM